MDRSHLFPPDSQLPTYTTAMSTTKPHSEIPALYRIYFKWSDPIILAISTYLYYTMPDLILHQFVPTSVAPRNPYHDFLLHQAGGGLLQMAVLTFVLLRYTEDVGVWKVVEFSVLVYDVALLYSAQATLAQQKRLRTEMVRREEWVGIAITLVAVVVRTLFLLGVGLSERHRVVKRA